MASAAHASTNDKQIRCLATNMYYEARGEGEKGMTAVGHVVMNRVESSKFPSTPCGVIYQKNKKTCQFSWVCSNRLSVTNIKLYERAVMLAKNIYNGNSYDLTYGATFFHAVYVQPYWAKSFKKTTRIGNHIFYRG